MQRVGAPARVWRAAELWLEAAASDNEVRGFRRVGTGNMAGVLEPPLSAR
jgi:hypothetical protein